MPEQISKESNSPEEQNNSQAGKDGCDREILQLTKDLSEQEFLEFIKMGNRFFESIELNTAGIPHDKVEQESSELNSLREKEAEIGLDEGEKIELEALEETGDSGIAYLRRKDAQVGLSMGDRARLEALERTGDPAIANLRGKAIEEGLDIGDRARLKALEKTGDPRIANLKKKEVELGLNEREEQRLRILEEEGRDIDKEIILEDCRQAVEDEKKFIISILKTVKAKNT